jgi:hypothetical protein
MTLRTGMLVRLRQFPRDDVHAIRRLKLGWTYMVNGLRTDDDTMYITLEGVKGEYDATDFVETCGCGGFSDD